VKGQEKMEEKTQEKIVEEVIQEVTEKGQEKMSKNTTEDLKKQLKRYQDTLIPEKDADSAMAEASWSGEVDNEGQCLIFTGVWRWKDGSFHNEPEEN
jgi:hypothetical protein